MVVDASEARAAEDEELLKQGQPAAYNLVENKSDLAMREFPTPLSNYRSENIGDNWR